MVGASNLILTDIKKVYENLKSMINNPILPTADGLISKVNIFL